MILYFQYLVNINVSVLLYSNLITLNILQGSVPSALGWFFKWPFKVAEHSFAGGQR